MLATKPFIGGERLSVADIHVIWGIRWVLNDLGAKQEKQLGKRGVPKGLETHRGTAIAKARRAEQRGCDQRNPDGSSLEQGQACDVR